MHFDELVTIGEIMDMRIGDMCVRTKLQDVRSGGRFIVFHPTIKGIPIPMQKGDMAEVTFNRPNGIYMFNAVVVNWYLRKNIKLCEFEAVTELSKRQRRKSYRLPIALDVMLERVDGEESEQAKRYKAKTVDISEHGMQLTCFENFEPGTQIVAHIKMPDAVNRKFKTEVLRCEKPLQSTDPSSLVLLFLNCSEYNQAFLRRFIMKQQIIARKKQDPGK